MFLYYDFLTIFIEFFKLNVYFRFYFFFKKDDKYLDKYYFKLEIRVAYREFLAFEYVRI